MFLIHGRALERNKVDLLALDGGPLVTSGTIIISLMRPYIAPSAEGGFYVLLNNGRDGWLVGDRRQALATFRELDAIERRGRA